MIAKLDEEKNWKERDDASIAVLRQRGACYCET